MSDLLVDDDLLPAVSAVRWRPNGVGYLYGVVDGKRVSMHRYVWSLSHEGSVPRMIDHINGNKLDNRLCNLRPATGSLNCRSRLRSNGGRLPEGVQPKPGPKPFFAHISLWRATLYLGSFYDVESASESYEKARRIILACEARRAEKGEPTQPVPPPAKSSLKRQWNKGWRAIFAGDEFWQAVEMACKFAGQFVPESTEAVA